MPNRNTNLAVYTAKVEAVEGTDATPASATDSIFLAENFDPSYDPAFTTPRDSTVKGALLHGSKPLPPAGSVYSWTKRAHWRGTTGAPTATNKHELDALLQAMGLSVTYDATPGAEKATYAPANTALKTISEYIYHDGKVRKGIAARADGSFSFDVGGPLVVECTTQGILSSEIDAAVPSDMVYKTTVPPTANDLTTLTVDGYAAGIIRKMEVRLGNEIQRRVGAKAVGGVAGFRIASRKITWSITLEEPLISEKDFRALQRSAADVALAAVIGATLYNSANFATATAVVESVAPSNDNGLALITIGGGIYGTSPFTLALQ